MNHSLRKKCLNLSILILFFSFLVLSLPFAQEQTGKGRISGDVVDETGQLVEGALIIVESLKTKIKNFKEGNTLIALPAYDKNIILAARNLSEIDTLWARDLNVLDVLSFKYLILPKDSIKVIQDTFAKK